MSAIAALSPEAFEARYVGGRDPWSFANDAYELGRYRAILASLHRSAYGTIYEPGCSIGVLTQQLAAIGECVIATDFAPSAIIQAQLRCAGHAHVQFICTDLRMFVPRQPLDLIVFCEIGYYFSEAELATLTANLTQTLLPGGEFLASHWLGDSSDHVLHGNRVHEILRDCMRWRPLQKEFHQGFRLDSWVKP